MHSRQRQTAGLLGGQAPVAERERVGNKPPVSQEPLQAM